MVRFCRYSSRALLIPFSSHLLDLQLRRKVKHFRSLAATQRAASSAVGWIISLGKDFVQCGISDVSTRLLPSVRATLSWSWPSTVHWLCVSCFLLRRYAHMYMYMYVHVRMCVFLLVCFDSIRNHASCIDWCIFWHWNMQPYQYVYHSWLRRLRRLNWRKRLENSSKISTYSFTKTRQSLPPAHCMFQHNQHNPTDVIEWAERLIEGGRLYEVIQLSPSHKVHVHLMHLGTTCSLDRCHVAGKKGSSHLPRWCLPAIHYFHHFKRCSESSKGWECGQVQCSKRFCPTHL